jgi:hypothetical protein
MRNFIFTVLLISCISACNSKKSENGTAGSDVKSEVSNATVYQLDSFLNIADSLVDKKVTVVGTVRHTCKFSGKRCFIVGDTTKVTFRVEAGGEIGGFNRELTGSKLAVTGFVREKRMTKEYIDQYEKEVGEMQKSGDGSEAMCSAELNSIKGMRNWMSAHNKDFYAIYYMEGEDYEVVEKLE